MTNSSRDQATDASHAARVLIVSDDTLMSGNIATVLRNAGHTVADVTSPAYALEACATQSFNLAIVDESVCESAGPELARALRDYFTVPTLFLSALLDPEIMSTSIEDGSLGFIVKPVDPASVLPALKIALRRAREIQQQVPRNGFLHQVDNYWRQLITMSNKLFTANEGDREGDAASQRMQHARDDLPAIKREQAADIERCDRVIEARSTSTKH